MWWLIRKIYGFEWQLTNKYLRMSDVLIVYLASQHSTAVEMFAVQSSVYAWDGKFLFLMARKQKRGLQGYQHKWIIIIFCEFHFLNNYYIKISH